MPEFHLDTSGAVDCETRMIDDGADTTSIYLWTDLDPFTQGYIEAALAEFRQRQERRFHENPAFIGQSMPAQRGFSDLAPETLARIIADCEAYVAARGIENRCDGAWFWKGRQSKSVKGFPPMTVSLGDDGEVYLT